MAIQFDCSCGRKLQAADEHVGRRVKCPACGAEATVPGDGAAVQPAEALPSRPGPVQAEEPPPAPKTDGERPPRRKREDDDEDDRPRRRRRRWEDEEEDDEDAERPRGERKTSGKATAALVLGLISLLLGAFTVGVCTAIPAIIFGILGLVEIGRSRGRLSGKGLAISGMILGCLGIALVPVGLVLAVQKVRGAAARLQSSNNLKQMAIAMHIHQDTYGHLPEAVPDPKLNGPTKMSWRVALLPYLDQASLYKALHHNEPWDSPHNKALLTSMPKVFAHPDHPEENAKGLTYYRVFVGEHTPFPPGKVTRIPMDFTDGTSNTILIVEAAEPVPWTKPDELVYDPKKPLPKLGGHFSAGTVVALADGSTVVLHRGISEQTTRAAITPADGDILGADWP